MLGAWARMAKLPNICVVFVWAGLGFRVPESLLKYLGHRKAIQER